MQCACSTLWVLLTQNSPSSLLKAEAVHAVVTARSGLSIWPTVCCCVLSQEPSEDKTRHTSRNSGGRERHRMCCFSSFFPPFVLCEICAIHRTVHFIDYNTEEGMWYENNKVWSPLRKRELLQLGPPGPFEDFFLPFWFLLCFFVCVIKLSSYFTNGCSFNDVNVFRTICLQKEQMSHC